MCCIVHVGIVTNLSGSQRYNIHSIGERAELYLVYKLRQLGMSSTAVEYLKGREIRI